MGNSNMNSYLLTYCSKRRSLNMLKFFIVAICVAAFFGHTNGHGRVMNPPGRGSAWRFGFPTEPNYTDMGLNCGGKDVQYNQNGGKCGICGDNWTDPSPRQNELGGLYGTGVIVGEFKKGQTMPVWVELTASHKGFFQFQLCNLSEEKETENCFKPLTFEGGAPHYNIESFDALNYTVPVQLPSSVTCQHCILRWQYTAGNSQGLCDDGTSSVECANQEMFKNCADITIQ